MGFDQMCLLWVHQPVCLIWNQRENVLKIFFQLYIMHIIHYYWHDLFV